MAKVLINQLNSHTEIISILAILLITVGSIIENVLGPSYWGWLCIIIGIGILYLLEKKPFWQSPFTPILIILATMSVISYFITTSPETTGTQLSRLWSGIIVSLIYFSWAQKKHRQITITLGLVGIGLGLALISPFIVQWLTNKSGFLPSLFYDFLPTPIVSNTVHPNIIASLLILLIPIPIAFILITLHNFNRQSLFPFIVLISVTTIMAIPLLLSKSRGGLLAGGLSMIFLLWFCHYKKIAQLLSMAFITIIIVAVYISVQSIDPTSSNLLTYGTFTFRTQVWGIAMMVLQDFPFTGVGIGTFNETASRLYPIVSAMNTNPGTHNLFLQIGTDLGLIGLITMASIYILTLFMGKNSIHYFAQQKDSISWGMAAGLTTGIIATLLQGIVDINGWGTRISFVPWLVIGLIGGLYVSTRLAKK